MKNIKIIFISMMLILIPIISFGATGHINGCTSTSFDTSCCTKTFKITPRAGYTVIDVIINGISQGPLTSYTFTNITGPQTLKVVTEAIGGTGTGGGELAEGQFKVLFNANTGTGSMASQIFEEGVTQKLNACTYTKEHYHFVGWSRTLNGSVEIANEAEFSATEETTLYAIWEPNVYTVTFDANGGTGSMTQNFTYGVTESLKDNTAITYTGRTFKGWSTTPEGSVEYANNSSYSATANVTLYAVWEIITYTITYDLAGGSVATANPTTYTILSDSITLVNPTRTGYTFAGWTGSNGSTASTTVTIPKGSTGNKTYTANWTPLSYTLTVPRGLSLTVNGEALNTKDQTTYTLDYDSIVNVTTGSGNGKRYIELNGTIVASKIGHSASASYTFTFTKTTNITQTTPTNCTYSVNGSTYSGDSVTVKITY